MRRSLGPSTPTGAPSSQSCDSAELNVSSNQLTADRSIAESPQYGRLNPPANSEDRQNFINRAVELAKTLTGANGAAIAFRGEQGTICCARSGEGAPPLGTPVDASAGISQYCLNTGQALRCDDIATDGRVDPEISRAGRIRAVAIVPIRSAGEISGILEVFSGTPGIFTSRHLKLLQQLADRVGAAAEKPSEEILVGSPADTQPEFTRDINLRVEVDSAYRALVRALDDILLRRSPSPSAGSSDQQVWNYVFVESHIPWKQFLGSVLLHAVVLGMVVGVSQIWPRELDITPYPLHAAHITYYPVSQSFSARANHRPSANTRPQHASAQKQILKVAREHHPIIPPDNRASDAAKKQALTSPPAMISGLQKPALPAAMSVLPAPPPPAGGASARQPYLPNSLVAPPPDVRGVSGSQRAHAPGTAVVPPSPDIRDSMAGGSGTMHGGQGVGDGVAGGATALSIVPPPPSVGDHAALTSRATGAQFHAGIEGVAPSPSISGGGQAGGRGLGSSLGNGLSQAVPPPPALAGGGNLNGGGGKANSQAGLGLQAVPPAQSLQNGGSYGAGGRGNSLAGAGSQVVPPSPSIDGTGNSGAGGRAGSLARADAAGAIGPGSGNGSGNSEPGGESISKDATIASVPETGGDQKHPGSQDVQLRVIALAWAPPSTSYFSNFEVFIAEKSMSRAQPQVIKLVYVFLPYQRRLSEFGTDNLKVRKLHVTRDPSCDESLMAMTWPEGEGGPTNSHSQPAASGTSDRNDALPCYRTTADDYRRALSGTQ